MVEHGGEPGKCVVVEAGTLTDQADRQLGSAADISNSVHGFEQDTRTYAASGGCTPAVGAFIGQATALLDKVAKERTGWTQDRAKDYAAEQLNNERSADLTA